MKDAIIRFLLAVYSITTKKCRQRYLWNEMLAKIFCYEVFVVSDVMVNLTNKKSR